MGRVISASAIVAEPLAQAVEAVRALRLQDHADMLCRDTGKLSKCLASLIVVDQAKKASAVGGHCDDHHQYSHQVAWIELPD